MQIPQSAIQSSLVKFDCFEEDGEEEKEKSEEGKTVTESYRYSLASDNNTLVTVYSDMFQFEIFLCTQYPFSPP